jgi:translocation and assembly module TamB
MVQLTDRDLRLIEERFGYRIQAEDTTLFDFFTALAMDISVEMERDTWLRQTSNPEMAIQFSGRLNLDKDAGELDPRIEGTIEVIPERSYVDQFGRRFNITNGTLTFNGTIENVVMDLQAEYLVPARNNDEGQVTITLSLEGRLEQPELTLGSDPQMTYTDIVSYIATGQPAGGSFQLGGYDALLTQGAGLAISQLTTILESRASEELGLDVVEIQQTNLGITELAAGKYVSPRLYVGVSQPISFGVSNTGQPTGTSATQVTLEYEFVDWLLLRLQGGNSSLQFNLFWEYAY